MLPSWTALLGSILLLLYTSNRINADSGSDSRSPLTEGPFQWASTAHNESLLVGTYRPNLYFGTRSRTKNTALTGLMWFGLGDYNGARNIRHACEQGDEWPKYGWQKHDGRNFGFQEIDDPNTNLVLKTSWVKGTGPDQNENWALRLSGTPKGDQATPLSLMFYASVDSDEMGSAKMRTGGVEPAKMVIDGRVPGEGNFSLFVFENKVGNNIPLRYWATELETRNVWNVRDRVMEVLFNEARSKIDPQAQQHPPPAALFQLPNTKPESSNVVVLQKILEPPFEIDIVFLSGKSAANPPPASTAKDFSTTALTTSLPALESAFDARFESTFKLAESNLGKKHVRMGHFALSNMVGALGYFYGSGLQKDESPMGFHETAAQVLFTAVPSRPFFPRGFFWDEGFHQMLIRRWDNDLSLDILQHWMNLIDENGWLAREQILGLEARSKVPAEFQIQDPTFANPPTWLFPLASFVDQVSGDSDAQINAQMPEISLSDDPKLIRERLLNDKTVARIFLDGAYDKLKQHYMWMRRSQSGRSLDEKYPECEGFRWRGRTVNHTLTSGLDDFPRANPPDDGELHVDLVSWIGLYAKTLASIAGKLGKEDEKKDFQAQFERVQNTLEKLHWNEDRSFYQDVVISEEGRRTFIDRIGYVGLLPFLLGVLPTCSDRTERVLDVLRDTDHLWSEYGLMSLSASDDDFGGGENYWKGPIWININYLALAALKNHYSTCPGSLGAEARRVYSELRQNVVENVYKEYRRTGYIWEQYSPLDGSGQRSHPFTGWSSLVLLMMAEMY